MQRMARRELLSARLCKVVFSDITWTQNQAKLEKLLGALEPLTTRKIDNILGSVFDWMAIQEQMEEIDSENNCFRYLVEHVQPENYNVVSSCLMNCRVNGYRHWLTPAYLMASLENAFDIHEILRAYHLLHKSGTWLLNLHFQEVAHNKPIRQALIQLDEAGILLSGEADNASHALRNTSFSDAVAILREAKIINSFEKAARKYYDADVTLFSKKDSRMLMDFLLTSPEHCEKLIVYTDHVFPLYTHEDESFEFHQDVLVKLLNTMLSKTNYLLLHSPKSHHEDRRVDEAIEKLEELLQRECGQACKM